MEKQREQTLRAVFNIWRMIWIRLDDWKNVQIEKIQFLLIIFSVCPTVEECAFTDLPVLMMFSYSHILLRLLHYIYLTGTSTQI